LSREIESIFANLDSVMLLESVKEITKYFLFSFLTTLDIWMLRTVVDTFFGEKNVVQI